MTVQAMALLNEFARQAGVSLPPAASDAYSAIVVGDRLIGVDMFDDGTLRLLAVIELPPGHEKTALSRAADHNGGNTDGPTVGFDETTRSLFVDRRFATHDLDYQAFERLLTEFVEVCERLPDQRTPAGAGDDAETPPDYAIFA